MSDKPLHNTIILGDIHGRKLWESIVSGHPDDDIIFIGDYFDSKENISAWEQIFNFKKILDLKTSDPNRITLLLGNHDFHYLPFANEAYGGYQERWADDIQEALRPALENQIMKIAKTVGNYLVSHAGFTRTWCLSRGISEKDPVRQVNEIFYKKPEIFKFTPGSRREPTGDEATQGPLWVRPASLMADRLPGWIQVVGHTQQADLQVHRNPIFVDVLGFSSKYLRINTRGEVAALEL
ncbi:MAG TPA: metallophosphoesterase [Phnomibacter sp.]|nr:metallophosphoesterase [Phnomibacter sp.]